MRRTVCAVGLALGLVLVSAGPVSAHLWNPTGTPGDETASCFIGDARFCYYRPSDPEVHSYMFVSGRNDSGGSQIWLCPTIWDGHDHGSHSECGWDFERYCYYLWTHSENDLDCHDQDNVSFYAAVWNGGPYASGGKMVGVHVLF